MLCIFLKNWLHCSGAPNGTFWPTLVTLLKDRLFRNSILRSHPFDALNEAHGIGYSLGNKTKAFLCIIFPLTDLPNFLSSRINSMIASSNSGYCAFPPRMLRRLEIFIALFLTESTESYNPIYNLHFGKRWKGHSQSDWQPEKSKRKRTGSPWIIQN